MRHVAKSPKVRYHHLEFVTTQASVLAKGCVLVLESLQEVGRKAHCPGHTPRELGAIDLGWDLGMKTL